MGSAYSTMTLQHDNKVGFLYEESTFGYDYTIVYKNYSLEQITDSAYTFYAADEAALKALRNEIVKNGINQKVDGLKKIQVSWDASARKAPKALKLPVKPTPKHPRKRTTKH